jgi:hypothetical protein
MLQSLKLYVSVLQQRYSLSLARCKILDYHLANLVACALPSLQRCSVLT